MIVINQLVLSMQLLLYSESFQEYGSGNIIDYHLIYPFLNFIFNLHRTLRSFHVILAPSLTPFIGETINIHVHIIGVRFFRGKLVSVLFYGLNKLLGRNNGAIRVTFSISSNSSYTIVVASILYFSS